MSRRNIIHFLFIVLVLNINAQGGWKRKHSPLNSGMNLPWAIFECPNGNFIEIGLVLDTINSPKEYKLTVLCTDPIGNFIWIKSTDGGKYAYLDCFSNRSVIVDTNGFNVVTTVVDTANEQMGMLIKFDLNGDTILRKVYNDPNPQEDAILNAFTKSVDDGYLMTGFSQSSSSSSCLVIKTDINGNEVWRKKIHKSYPDVQAGLSITQDSLTKKIIIVGYQYLSFSQGVGTNSNILILDEFGNKLVQNTMNNYDGGAFGEIIQLKDKNFLTCGSANANSNQGLYPRYNSTVVKFDIFGNTLWTKLYDTAALYNRINLLVEESSGDITMGGFLDTNRNYNLDVILKLKIFRTDKNGNIKWKKNIGHSFDHWTSEGAVSMRATHDKGLIFATRFPYETDPKFYGMIKIDSTGCDTLEAWCKSVILGLSDFSKAHAYNSEIFPNPSMNFVTIKLAANLSKPFTVKLSDVTGTEIESLAIEPNENFKLTTATYKTGFYLLNIFYEGKKIETKKLLVQH